MINKCKAGIKQGLRAFIMQFTLCCVKHLHELFRLSEELLGSFVCIFEVLQVSRKKTTEHN